MNILVNVVENESGIKNSGDVVVLNAKDYVGFLGEGRCQEGIVNLNNGWYEDTLAKEQKQLGLGETWINVRTANEVVTIPEGYYSPDIFKLEKDCKGNYLLSCLLDKPPKPTMYSKPSKVQEIKFWEEVNKRKIEHYLNKNVTVLQTYKNRTLIKQLQTTHTDFIITTDYNHKTHTWNKGVYYSVINSGDIDSVRAKAERAFFLEAVKDIDGGNLDFSKFNCNELKRAYNEYQNFFRGCYIKEELNKADILLSNEDIHKMSSEITDIVNKDDVISKRISKIENDYINEKITNIAKSEKCNSAKKRVIKRSNNMSSKANSINHVKEKSFDKGD